MTERAPIRSRGRRARTAGLSGLVLLAAVAVFEATSSAGRTAATTSGPPIAWAPVVRTDLVAPVPVAGALAYQGTITLFGERSGVAYTRLPSPGQRIARGQLVAAVDEQPSFLFYGRV